MPRRTEAEQEEDSGRQEMRSDYFPSSAGAPPANQITEEELIALLREQQYRQQQAAALAAALPPSLAASYLLPREGVGARHFATAAPRASAAPFLSAEQPQSLNGLSVTTILELARTRPDLLAMLQQPSVLFPQPAQRPNVVVVHPRYPANFELSPGKRAHNGEHKDNTGTGKLEKDDQKVEEAEQDEQDYAARPPKKRVLFQRAARAVQQEQAQDRDRGSNEEESKVDQDAWTAEEHRNFVEAVFTMGMKHASPSVLLDFMSNVHEFPLTSERVKSRLQKFRNHGDKSKSDFMQEYDTFLQRALSIGSQHSASRLLPTAALLQIMGQELPLYGGEAAALSTYEMLYQNRCPTQSGGRSGGQEEEFDNTVHRFLTPDVLKRGSETLLDHCQGQSLEIPHLTAEEKATPLGSCLEHVVGTFQALAEQLEQQRHETNKEPAKTPKIPTNGETSSSKSHAAPQVLERPPDDEFRLETGETPSQGTHQANEDEQEPTTTTLKAPPEAATALKPPPESRPEDKPEEKERIEKLVALMYQQRKGNRPVL